MDFTAQLGVLAGEHGFKGSITSGTSLSIVQSFMPFFQIRESASRRCP
jgi:hypothetical protein